MRITELLATLESDMQRAGVTGLTLGVGKDSLALHLDFPPPAAPVSAPAVAIPEPDKKAVKAPWGGCFLPFASGRVKAGQVIGAIEAGLLRLPVIASTDASVLPTVEARRRVGFGDTLFTSE